MNTHYHNYDDDVKTIFPTWFFLPYCDEFEKNREFVNNICSHRRTHRLLVTCDFCHNILKTFNDRKVRCSSCRWSTKRNLKTYNFENISKIANVYNIK